MKNFKGVFYALVSSATFGLIPLFSLPLLFEYNMASSSVLFYRFVFSTLMMGAICVLRRENLKLQKKYILPVVVLGTFYALTAMLLLVSYRFMPSGIATTVHFLYPICVSFLMVVFFKERKSSVLFIAAILSLIGVGLMCWSTGDVRPMGLAVASVTIITYAVYIVGVNKTSVREIPAEVLTFYVLLMGAILFTFYALSDGGVQAIPNANAGWHLFLLALMPTVVSDLTLILAIKYAGSIVTSILGSMEPLVAVFVGVLYFSEAFTFNSFIGIALILVSVVMVILSNQKKAKELTPDLVNK